MKRMEAGELDFEGENLNSKLIVDKGSICINGISLTVAKIL